MIVLSKYLPLRNAGFYEIIASMFTDKYSVFKPDQQM
jgi:hypothetical protein